MKICITQPNFLPWRGYFQMLHDVDMVVFYDDVQYTKADWRNRNKIKTATGPQWITVPVKSKNHMTHNINEAEIDGDRWQKKMLKTIERNYSKAPYFEMYYPELKRIIGSKFRYISGLSITSTMLLCDMLGFRITSVRSSDLCVDNNLTKAERLFSVCDAVGATHYLSGPSAKDYIGDGESFKEHGIRLEYQEYDYKPYPQLYGSFEDYLSVIDLLFNCGKNSGYHIFS